MPKECLTVLVPCFDEEGNVAATVADIQSYRASLPTELRLILIDDGSTDGTRERMEELTTLHDNVLVRVNPKNMGIGRSVMAAYEDVPDGSWVTVMPGDNEFHFASIQNFLALRDHFDLMLGYIQNGVVRPMHRRLASHLYMASVRTAYGLPYRYLNGMKMYKVEVFKGIEVTSTGHAYNAELIAKAILRNPFLRITDVPFVLRGRRDGTSKAFRAGSVATAAKEFLRGRASVTSYRRNTLGIKD
jgi:glycosyltransferase involved in cell wall biosynthesis